ncbi:MAG: DUF541 domain-containing protein [Chloroflexi bacterium]|nr:DUF541 domain-containing protein [Chloroflexota bacterium]MYE41588.1 DUF541 domain-containing protein [Chloroflexota bacterium]
MTLLSGRNGIYLLLATLALAGLFAFGWVTLAGAQGENSDTEEMDASGSDTDSGVSYNGPSGIWVTGNGKASGAPDIAVVSMGVESVEETAAAARANAARAMQSVMNALTRAGIADADIQTRHFNINPRYQSVEIERCDDNGEGSEGEQAGTTEKTCYTIWESRLTGYSVSNQATVKIRNQDDVGAIIDQVTEAAGNLVRINGISFNIEDPQPLRDEARADAVADMKRKATMLAELSEVKLGRLVYLNEGGAYSPPQPLYGRVEAAFAMADSFETSISPGEMDISVTVQGVFLIAEESD